MSTKYIASNWRLPNKAGVDSYLNDNYGLTFDGSELIDCGADTNLDLNKSFSISTWIKFTSTSSMVVLSKREATKISLLIELGSGKPFTAIRDASSNIAITNTYSGTYNDGNWHHIIATFDRTANELKLYVDNELKETANTSSVGDIAPTTNNLIIGRRSDTSSSFFNGSISEVAIFDYALSSTQISTLYGSSSLGSASPMALKPAPVAFYPLGDNSSGNPLTQPNEAVEEASVFNFDSASSQFIDVPTTDSINFTSAFSTAMWFKTTSTASMFSSHGTSSIKYFIQWTGSSNRIRLRIYDSTNAAITIDNIPSQDFDNGNWHHLAFTTDGTTSTNKVIIYLNGQELSNKGTLANTGIKSVTGSLKIGALNDGSNTFDGQLSNFQAWNTELTSTEVTTLYNSGVPLLTGTQPQASNLKAWYKLDQSANWDVSGSGYWDIPDASGNGNDGISSGMTSANLVLTDLTRNLPYDSYSFNFDSTSDDHINCGNPSALNITGSITLSCWVKSSNTAANYKLLIKDNGTSRSFQINTNHASLGPYVYFWTDGGTIVTTNAGTPNVLVDGNWHNLVCMFKSGDYVRMYIDGVQVGNTSVTQTTLDSSTADFIISTDGNNGTVGVDGNVSNVSVFNEALTSTEVMKLYSNGMPQDLSSFSPAPVAWWTLGSNSFFNGSNFICKDLIGSNDGTSVNAGVDSLQGNTPRSEANGTGTNMDIPTNLEGQTKYSSNNSWSINMSESARVADTP